MEFMQVGGYIGEERAGSDVAKTYERRDSRGGNLGPSTS
jgi:hypothetical protein